MFHEILGKAGLIGAAIAIIVYPISEVMIFFPSTELRLT